MATTKKAPKGAQKTTTKLSLSSAKELEVLRKIVEITNSELDLAVVLKDVVKVVNDMTKADSVFIYLFDPARKNLVLMASKTPHKKELGKVILKAGLPRKTNPLPLKKTRPRINALKVLMCFRKTPMKRSWRSRLFIKTRRSALSTFSTKSRTNTQSPRLI